MKKITGFPFLAFILSAFVLASCGKDDDTVNPGPGLVPSGEKCVVTSVEAIDGSDSYVVQFELDNQRRFSKATLKENGTLINEAQLYEYNNEGRVSKLSFLDEGALEYFTTYTYNANGKLTRSEEYDHSTGAPVLYSARVLEYDSNKRLTKSSRFDDSNVLESYSVFTYPTPNTVQEQDFYVQAGSPTLSGTTVYTLGNKKGLEHVLGVMWNEEVMNEFNILSETWTDATPGAAPETTTYTYQHNADGYPTQVNIDYGGSTETYNLTYNCL